MIEQNKTVIKPWMLTVVAILLTIFNFGPAVDALENIFGVGVDKCAIEIILLTLIVYAFVKKN